MKTKRQRKLYGIRIHVDGKMYLQEIRQDEKWNTICKILGTRRTERYEGGGFNGNNRIVVCDAYATAVKGKNEIASRLVGKDVFGTAVLLRENEIGIPVLMTDGGAFRMKQEVERGW